MSDPFLGEIDYFGFPFAPYKWATASGQTIPIQQNTSLFSLIGVNFGGNGTTTFALPNLASRQACGTGNGPGLTPRTIGETFGAFQVTLTNGELPQHNHLMPDYLPQDATTNSILPTGGAALSYGAQATVNTFAAPGAPAPMNPGMITPTGQSLPHDNTQPYLGLSICIALSGTYPSFG